MILKPKQEKNISFQNCNKLKMELSMEQRILKLQLMQAVIKS
jgi:hypothetical protein